MRRSAVLPRFEPPGVRRTTNKRPAFSSNLCILAFSLLLVVVLAGCGGGNASQEPTTISVSPTALSINLGDVRSIAAFVEDANGQTLTNPPVITFASSNGSVATVSSGGLVCAGVWDANFIVCDASNAQPGTANIVITSGSLTATVPVYTHLHVDRVTVSPASVDCKSSGQTQQLTAKAFSNGVDVTSTVGPFIWRTLSTDVATVDTNGLVTARTPGQTTAFATVSEVVGVPVNWVTCPVQSIHVHVANAADTSFSLAAVGNTSTLAADVVDSHGVTVTPPLIWASSQPSVASVSASGLATAVAAGTTGVTASCSSGCNIGLSPVYGNVVTGTVAGTSSTTIYATGTGATTLVPITSATNAAGTGITLPSSPNSFLLNRQGTTGYLGSDAGLITLDVASNTVTQNSGLAGKVLAVSADGNRLIVAGTNLVSVVGVGAGIVSDSSSIAGATAADFTSDSLGAYILSGSTLYFWTPGNFKRVPLAGTAKDVKFLANGAFAYVAGGTAGPAAAALATCDNSLADTVALPAVPNFLASLPDASKVLAVDSPGIDVIIPATSLAGCPPPLSDTLASVDLGAGAFTPRQLIVLPDGSKAYVTSDLGQLLGLNTADSTPFAIPLANGANAFTGGSTLDGKMLYVGGSDNAVHRIDVASAADAQQISVSFTPDLVAVTPK